MKQLFLIYLVMALIVVLLFTIIIQVKSSNFSTNFSTNYSTPQYIELPIFWIDIVGELAQYNTNKSKGITYSPEYNTKMAIYQAAYNEAYKSCTDEKCRVVKVIKE